MRRIHAKQLRKRSAIAVAVLTFAGGGAATFRNTVAPDVLTGDDFGQVTISPYAGVAGTATYVHPVASGGYVDPVPYSPVEVSKPPRWVREVG